jgi:hypothetical protein
MYGSIFFFVPHMGSSLGAIDSCHSFLL